MISSNYSSGPNLGVVSDILGEYWRLLFSSQELIEAVCRAQGTTLDCNEILERDLVNWLDEQKAGYLGRTIRVASIPAASIYLKKACIGDRLTISGSGYVIGQASSRMCWVAKLPFNLVECPYIGIQPDVPLLTEGIDYTFDGKDTLLFHSDPSAVGFKRILSEVVDYTPVFALQMVFLACIPEGYTNGYNLRYGRYNVKESARSAVFTLLVEEASVLRIKNAVMACLGAVVPSIFEEEDEAGAFTWIRKVVTEGANTLMPTSGGELAVIPTALGPKTPAETWKHRPGDSLCDAVTLDEASDPPTLTISEAGLALVSDNMAVFQAIKDSLPAGNPLKTAFSISFEDTAAVSIAEVVVPFIVYEYSEDVAITCTEVIRSRSNV